MIMQPEIEAPTNLLQTETLKIQECSKQHSGDLRLFVCGACKIEYRTYSALYLHIRRKHNGIRPPNTKFQKHKQTSSQIKSRVGRPKKSNIFAGIQNETETPIEIAHNEFMWFLNQELEVAKGLSHKPSLETVVSRVLNACDASSDKWLKDIQKESKVFLLENEEKDAKSELLDFERDFVNLDPKEGLKVIVWFVMWLGSLYVKPEFVPDLCTVASRIWKVMDVAGLEPQDLENKIVWKRVIRETESLLKRLPNFNNDLLLLSGFIQRVCELIGKAFENRL